MTAANWTGWFKLGGPGQCWQPVLAADSWEAAWDQLLAWAQRQDWPHVKLIVIGSGRRP